MFGEWVDKVFEFSRRIQKDAYLGGGHQMVRPGESLSAVFFHSSYI